MKWKYTLIKSKNEGLIGIKNYSYLQSKIIFLYEIYWITQGTPKMQVMIDNLHKSTITSATNEIK